MLSWSLATLGAAVLAGCGHSSAPVSAPADSARTTAAPVTRHDLANRCFLLQADADQAHARRAGDGYAATAAQAADGERFYLKPTALGRYLVYARDRVLLTATGSAVTAAAAPSDGADWTVEAPAPGRYTLSTGGRALSAAADGRLVMADTPQRFRFVPANGCSEYPELGSDVSGRTYQGRGIDQPVIGFADVHTHMAMAHEMSGAGGVGPSAGGTLYGQMFNRFGAPEALKDCAAWHGPQGTRDPDNIIHANPLAAHETQGWPTFSDWPSASSLTHQGMYYKWVERAWKAGLRILVNHGTNIDALCQLGRAYVSTSKPDNAGADCDDMSLGLKQLAYLKEMQDYVDAQEGGPGRGWFRIVGSPAEARAVINDGKLAVVPGLEFSHVFNCKLTVNPDGSETGGCDKAGIDRQIEHIHQLGIRQLFPYHDVDSALGGTGIFNGDVLNLLNFYDTGRFWSTYDCPDGGEGESYFYAAGARMTTAIPGSGGDPLTTAVIERLQGPAPIYPPERRQCNARGMTELGRYAVEQLMKKKFIIDIDHAELSIKQQMIDMAKAQTPGYPLLSAHGGHGGISTQQARDILALGGLIYPYKPNGRGQAEFVKKLKPLADPRFLFAVGYGSDTNGFGGLAGPRGAGAEPVRYPFTLFRGPGWGPQFAGIAPLSFGLQTVPESGKTWNVDEVGMAHYGLVADFVEETRIEGGEEAVTALYNSAEAYLRMWERVVNR